jgi:NitT/TauT family transport system substrate-binding protein
LLGSGAPSSDAVGIQVPDGQVLGDPGNVKLRFDTEYMALAADGKL